MTIKNEKMHAVFTKIESNMDQIKAVKNAQSEDKAAQLIALYLQTAALLEDSLQVLAREKKEEKKKNETVSNIFTNLPIVVVE